MGFVIGMTVFFLVIAGIATIQTQSPDRNTAEMAQATVFLCVAFAGFFAVLAFLGSVL